MQHEVTFRIVLSQPPVGVDFGLQKGRGADYETIQTQRRTKTDLSFELAATVKPGTGGAGPDFRGPFVQGPPGARFVYIDIGTYAGQTDTPWSRRLKVPLTGITWNMIERASRDARARLSRVATGFSPVGVLETHLPGTGKDGSPACATVKPFPGWKVGRAGGTGSS